MSRLVVIGNSGSGKSTFARHQGLPHLDLDPLAWLPTSPPERRAIALSAVAIDAFVAGHPEWVIEGCYADLAAIALPSCTRLYWLEPGIEACVANARTRPWEPHKYATRQAQDANLEMLIAWIRAYATRDDACSLAAHRALFDRFVGDKCMLSSSAGERIGA